MGLYINSGDLTCGSHKLILNQLAYLETFIGGLEERALHYHHVVMYGFEI